MGELKTILIVGGGTSGWMTAAMLRKMLPPTVSIRLIESDKISTIGVGEASIPPMQTFNHILGLDESEFVRETKASFKLGINFVGWGSPEGEYFHPFGTYLNDEGMHHFSQYYGYMRSHGVEYPFESFSLNTVAAKKYKFADCKGASGFPMNTLQYAYHLDAGLYAKYLRKLAEAWGVDRTEGTVREVKLDQYGSIGELVTDDGRILSADFFVDCSGFKGLLIEGALKSEYESWDDYLPCDRAIAVPSEKLSELPPYTESTTLSAGWKWRIPLQHRTGNGYVYSSRFISDDEAMNELVGSLDNEPLAEPRIIKFDTGRRKKSWNRNCVSVGLSSGFIEPLESTSIHLVQSAVHRLLRLLPSTVDFSIAEKTFNKEAEKEIILLRDFISLHYIRCNQNGEFWKFCREKLLFSDRLEHKLQSYENTGYITRDDMDLFGVESWFAVMEGQGVKSKYSTLAMNSLNVERLKIKMSKYLSTIEQTTKFLPCHEAYIEKMIGADLFDLKESSVL